MIAGSFILNSLEFTWNSAVKRHTLTEFKFPCHRVLSESSASSSVNSIGCWLGRLLAMLLGRIDLGTKWRKRSYSLDQLVQRCVARPDIFILARTNIKISQKRFRRTSLACGSIALNAMITLSRMKSNRNIIGAWWPFLTDPKTLICLKGLAFQNRP